MSRYSSKDVGFFLIGGYDVLGRTTDVEAVGEEQIEVGTEGLGDAWEESASLGISNAAMTQNGFYDDASASMNDALIANLGESAVGLLAFAGNVLGRSVSCFAGALEATFQRAAGKGKLTRAMASYVVTGEFVRGAIVAIHAAVTGGNGTSVDNGASSADGASAYLEVSTLALGGYTSVTTKVQDSPDEQAWADLVSFTAVTAAQTAERVTVAGTVDRYTRVVDTFNGSGSSQSVTRAVALHRN